MELATNQVALLSGCGDGLGRDTALLLAREGADLVISARRPDMGGLVEVWAGTATQMRAFAHFETDF